ncbi:hypothetical protein [Streptomyces sp. 8P21H-1]|uniref:hypothetical protein n=1 Tax=Streptomyces sp. 8P21H-1 TaxID=2737048 RepID=UPI00156D9B1E|nr:hypothetical protein [Streptomyces sp. 8P21H-1]NSL42677.1 hypothetical protein [Streptomyces sp. 8P21H-1]
MPFVSLSASGAKTQAALKFAKSVVETRGFVSDQDLEEVRAAGHGDGEIGEIGANVAPNVFTDYFDSVARTDIDFPVVDLPGK